MELISLIILLSAVTGCLSQNATMSCNPDIDCSTATLLDNVPNPDSCTSYYICVEVAGQIVPSDVPFECPVSEYFDHATSACVTEDGPSCLNMCNNYCNTVCDSTTEGSRLAAPGEVDKYNLCVGGLPVATDCPPSEPFFDGTDCVNDASAVCDFCFPYCSQVGIQVADPTDCTSFYICEGVGSPNWDLRATCETGEVFNPVSGDCIVGATCNNVCLFIHQ